MNLLNRILVLSMFMVLGCTPKPKVIYETKYIEVETPIYYKLDKPDRPKYLYDDSIHDYLLKILEYTESLENIIEENNKEKM